MPRRPALLLALATTVLLGGIVGACRRQPAVSEQPDTAPAVVAGPTLDTAAICRAGCERLERCVPTLAGEADGDPAVIASRLAQACDPTCEGFADADAGRAVDACLDLGSCGGFWSCVGSEEARPWLAAVAPVGDRSCENLCSQASACAINKACETEAEADPGRRSKPGKPGKPGNSSNNNSNEAEAAAATGDAGSCVADQVRRDELEETCLLQCRGVAEDSVARFELVGCLDAGSCDGMLACLDGWATTDYSHADAGPVPGAVPGMDEACDGFCTRAIVCGAEAEGLTLGPSELAELKQTMTSTYVECAVQCESDLGDDKARERVSQCTAAETCAAFESCADAI